VDTTKTQVQAIIENAKKLGLTWEIRPATVAQGANPRIVTAVYDGDSEAIIMRSLIGRIRPNARVVCMAVPPATNYIIGYDETLTNDTRSTRVVGIRASGNLTLATGSGVIVPGTELTVTTYFADAVLNLTAFADIGVTAFTTGGIGIGEIFVNGVAETPQILWEATAVSNRATVGQTYVITLPTPGANVIGMYGRKSGGTNTIVIRGTHSGWSATVVDGP
jgi:hypothetical protein